MSFDGPNRQLAARSSAQAQVACTIDFLSGDWTVTRQISDHRTGQVGSFWGTASFYPASATTPVRTLAYTESGELRFGSHRGPAGRSLIVVDSGDGAADVRFADGREFYRLDLRTGSCAAEHPCRADRYDVTVTQLSADSYTEAWRVTGPFKDYELHATFIRVGTATFPAAAGGQE